MIRLLNYVSMWSNKCLLYRENTIVQIANRIRDCFNVLLGKMLLYKFERQQYAEVGNSSKIWFILCKLS